MYIKTILNRFNLLNAKGGNTPADVNVHLSKSTSNEPINFPYRAIVYLQLYAFLKLTFSATTYFLEE